MLLALLLSQLAFESADESPILSQPSLITRTDPFSAFGAGGIGVAGACLCSQSRDFTAGANPYGIAFDGTYVYTANFSSNTVTQYTTAGVTVRAVNVGAGPHGVSYDSSTGSLWSANYTARTLTRFNPDGGIVGTYSTEPGDGGNIGAGPTAVETRHTGFLWTSNILDDTVTKLTSAGAFVDGYSTGVSTAPVAIHYESTTGTIWTANYASASVTKLSTAGVILGTYSVGTSPYGIASENGHIWVANLDSDTVTELNAADGSLIGTFATGDGPHAIIYSRGYIWVAQSYDDKVAKIDPATGATVQRVSLTATAYPHMLVDDGTYIWTADYFTSKTSRTLFGTPATGTRGQALTSSRASLAYCNKSTSATTLATGDLVLCARDEARIQPGDGGVLGLSSWAARTNSVWDSVEFGAPNWTAAGAGAYVMPVEHLGAMGPAGVADAVTLDYPASSAGNTTDYSLYFPTNMTTVSTAAWSSAVIAKSPDGGSGTFCVSHTPDAVTYKTLCCSVDGGSEWGVCCFSNQTFTAAPWRFFIGFDGRNAPQRFTQPAFSVTIAKPQWELGATCSPPIDTRASSTATRAAEYASFEGLTLPSGSVVTSYPASSAWTDGGSVTLGPLADGGWANTTITLVCADPTRCP